MYSDSEFLWFRANQGSNLAYGYTECDTIYMYKVAVHAYRVCTPITIAAYLNWLRYKVAYGRCGIYSFEYLRKFTGHMVPAKLSTQIMKFRLPTQYFTGIKEVYKRILRIIVTLHTACVFIIFQSNLKLRFQD